MESNYTKPYPMGRDFEQDQVTTESLAWPDHPFRQILAVTDGTCGSTCAHITINSYLYSLVHPEATVIRYVS